MQHYIKLTESEKNRKLNDLLDALDFNQVVIFVKSVSRAAELNKLLCECNFPSICIHSGMTQEERYIYMCSLLHVVELPVVVVWWSCCSLAQIVCKFVVVVSPGCCACVGRSIWLHIHITIFSNL